LFLFSASDSAQLENQIERVLGYAERLSRSELTDLAVRLSETLRPLPVRAAVVASSPVELSSRLEALKSHLHSGATRLIDPRGGLFFGPGTAGVSPATHDSVRFVDVQARRLRSQVHTAPAPSPHIGFLFPGQGSPSYKDGGAWRRRFNFL